MMPHCNDGYHLSHGLTFKKATEMALAHETAIKNAKVIRDGNGTPQSVNSIFNPQRSRSSESTGTSKLNLVITVGNPITRLLNATVL